MRRMFGYTVRGWIVALVLGSLLGVGVHAALIAFAHIDAGVQINP